MSASNTEVRCAHFTRRGNLGKWLVGLQYGCITPRPPCPHLLSPFWNSPWEAWRAGTWLCTAGKKGWVAGDSFTKTQFWGPALSAKGGKESRRTSAAQKHWKLPKLWDWLTSPDNTKTCVQSRPAAPCFSSPGDPHYSYQRLSCPVSSEV